VWVKALRTEPAGLQHEVVLGASGMGLGALEVDTEAASRAHRSRVTGGWNPLRTRNLSLGPMELALEARFGQSKTAVPLTRVTLDWE